jgi:hypothetical protein
MIAKVLSRMFVVSFVGIALGFWWQHMAQGFHMEGREAFVSEKGLQWDRLYSHPHHLETAIAVNVILVAALVGLYELLVAGLSKLFRSSGGDGKAS